MPPEENVAFVTEEKAAGSAPSPSFVTPNGNVVALEVDGGEPRATTGPEKAGIAEDAPFSPSEVVRVGYRDIAKNWALLGYTAFGGPAAHIGIFQKIFVDRLHWLTAAVFTELLALCQCLPGPTSTQLSFAIGLVKKGVPGGLLSGILFQYPGALIMTGLGVAAYKGLKNPQGAVLGLAHGFSAAGVALVAGAAYSLGRKLCATRVLAFLSAFAAVWALYWPKPYVFPAVIVFGGLVTLWTERHNHKPRAAGDPEGPPPDKSDKIERLGIGMVAGAVLLFVWASLLVTLIILRRELEYTKSTEPLYWFELFYRTGSIVYGGGQVVLPTLFEELTKPRGPSQEPWVTSNQFLAGLGLISALPGPLFNFAAFLGTVAALRAGIPWIAGALLGWVGIFAPGVLLIFGVMPYWRRFRENRFYKRALPGLNASAVGLIFASVASMFLKLYNDPQLEQKTWVVCIMAIVFALVELLGVPAPIGVVLGGGLGVAGWAAGAY